MVISASVYNPPYTMRPAALSAILPGLGQFHAGERARGGGILLAVTLTAGLAAWYGGGEWYLAPALLWLWGIWDAYHVRRNTRRPAGIPIAIVLALCYGIGWQVAEIDFGALTRNAGRGGAVLGPMLRPDFVGLRMESQQTYLTIEVPCSDAPPPTQREGDGLSLAASAGCGRVGEQLTISGSGFWPDAGIELWWEDTIGERQHLLSEGEIVVVYPDGQGTFSSTITIPQMRSGTGQEANLEQPLPERFVAIQARPIGGIEITDNGWRVLGGIGETISLALVATTLAVFFAAPLGFAAAHNLMNASPATLAIYTAVRGLLNVVRSIEPLIIAIVFVSMVGPGPFAGMLAIMLHSVAALGKLFSETVEAIDPGPLEAIRATGANGWQVVWYGVIPQVVPSFTAYTLYRWDINVRSSIIIGLVGGGGIGVWLFQWIIIADYRAVGAAFIAVVLVVMALDFASARVRARLV